jgi:hypothetical protein
LPQRVFPTDVQIALRQLNELFMLDQAELDFGIYRVMNFRRKEIKSFIENDLLNQVKTELDKITKTRLTTSASTASSSA